MTQTCVFPDNEDEGLLITLLERLHYYNIGPIGTVYWVSTTGSDANDGSWGSPFLTIAHAVDQATTNHYDVVAIMPGVYDENAHKNGVIILKEDLTIMGASNNPDSVEVRNTHASVESLFSLVYPTENVNILNLKGRNAVNTVIGIKADAPYTTIREVYFRGNMAYGIKMETTHGCCEYGNIKDCLFVGQETDAILLEMDNGTEISGNRIFNQVGHGIHLSQKNNDNFCTIKNNIVWDCGGTGIKVESDKNAIFNNCVDECGTDYDDTGNNNVFGGNHKISQILAGNTIEEDLEAIYDGVSGANIEGTTTQNWNAAEADIVSIGTDATNGKITSLLVDINGLTAGATITLRLYQKINGTERCFWEEEVIVDTDTDGIPIIDAGMGIHDVVRVTAESDTAGDDGKPIEYEYVTEG